ncbi:chromosomal replication initiator protein DnaA [Buchnera aphidicola]|uniref:Chromosomal replication initiator protein DnaA n=1 Tax=Buchnera aphidicola (Cinara strobi) TaxID=1921549 RepID=A0A3B1DKD7_9GAMM|nr:chromosomal replication initiator protein DnaA [Buchnera aphidicola]VAX76191.1 Chromosomal replication initiator protein DnaA [Buchnera aphidicola (Cinara strobi)]
MSLSIWKKCLMHLKLQLSPKEFSMWILPLKAVIRNNIISLYAPNNFVLQWVKNQYIKNFKELLYRICDHNPPFIILQVINKDFKFIKNNQFLYNQIAKKKTEDEVTSKKKILNIPTYLYTGINKKYQFHNFIEGKSNQLARYSSYVFTNNFKNFYNPLFLYSNTGLGKTHLLHAIGNKILIENKKKKVIYIHAEDFIQNMVNSLKNKSIEKFKNYYRSIDVLLLDDIQFFSNKKHSQEELFNTFNALFNKEQKIVLTANCCPNRIKGIAENLKSRFKWGLTISIDPPELNARINILLQKAVENKINLSYEVAKFIAQQLHSNIRELEGILKKIQITALFTKKTITIELVKKTLKKVFRKKKKNIGIILIQKTVAEYFNITVKEMISKKRSRFIVQPRQIAMALIKKITNYSFSDIGVAFGKKDHTTALHAYKKIHQLKKKKNKIYNDFIYLLNQLNS